MTHAYQTRARQLIHDMTSLPGRSAQDCMLELQHHLRTLCIQYFPKRRSHSSAPSQLLSISSRMWNARTEALRFQGRSLRALFKCWGHVTTFLVCTKGLAPDGLPALVWKYFATELAWPGMNTFVECLDGVSHSTSVTLDNGLDPPPSQAEQNSIQTTSTETDRPSASSQ